MAGYIGSKASVVSSGAERKKVFDITTSTTALTGLSYTANQVHVFHNGVRLISGTDYTETNDTTITLTNAAENGDQVVVVSYASFQTSDTVSASAGGTFSNDVTVSGDLNTTDVLPSTNDTSDLGSTAKRYQDLYLSGGVYLGGTGSANLLDDYEEGTWTPVLTFGGGSVGITYAAQTGTYIKVGQVVFVAFKIILTNKGTDSGGAVITGLPFPHYANSQENASTLIFEAGGSGVNLPNGYAMSWNDSKAYLRYQASAGYVPFDNTHFTNSTQIFTMMTYRVN